MTETAMTPRICQWRDDLATGERSALDLWASVALEQSERDGFSHYHSLARPMPPPRPSTETPEDIQAYGDAWFEYVKLYGREEDKWKCLVRFAYALVETQQATPAMHEEIRAAVRSYEGMRWRTDVKGEIADEVGLMVRRHRHPIAYFDGKEPKVKPEPSAIVAFPE